MTILMGQSSTCLILNTCTVCVLQAQLNGLWCCLLVGSSQCLRVICPLLCHFGVSWAAVETYYQQIDTVCVCVCEHDMPGTHGYERSSQRQSITWKLKGRNESVHTMVSYFYSLYIVLSHLTGIEFS